MAENGEGEFFKRYFDIPFYYIRDTHMKVVMGMGDAAAVGIVRALYPVFGVDEVRVKKILFLLRNAFDIRNPIKNESDRAPIVAMLLLELLKARAETHEQLKSIEETIHLIAEKR